MSAALAFSYFATRLRSASLGSAILVTALFHRRYLRAQREFIRQQRPWLDFVFVAMAEWVACGLTAFWLSARAQRASALEVFALCFGMAMIARYILRKELLQDVRGLRKESRADEIT